IFYLLCAGPPATETYTLSLHDALPIYGGWVRKKNGKIEPKMGAKWRILAKIFANPDLPEIDDYYEPFDFDYGHLQTAAESQTMRSEEHTSELQSRENLVCRLLLEKKKE